MYLDSSIWQWPVKSKAWCMYLGWLWTSRVEIVGAPPSLHAWAPHKLAACISAPSSLLFPPSATAGFHISYPTWHLHMVLNSAICQSCCWCRVCCHGHSLNILYPSSSCPSTLPPPLPPIPTLLWHPAANKSNTKHCKSMISWMIQMCSKLLVHWPRTAMSVPKFTVSLASVRHLMTARQQQISSGVASEQYLQEGTKDE